MKRELVFALVSVALAGCRATSAQPPESAGVPHPASVHCTQQGHQLEMRTAADGSQQGWCIFADGSECDEWAYYRGELAPLYFNASSISFTR